MSHLLKAGASRELEKARSRTEGLDRLREGEVGIHPRLIEEGEVVFQCEGKIRVGDAHLPGVMDPERVSGRVVDVKVP